MAAAALKQNSEEQVYGRQAEGGRVYLVGAGLGEAEFLTVRAQELLTQAEVVVYDALVDAQLLQLVPQTCLKFNVGKRGGQPSMPQAEINRLLVEQCQQGKVVIRLKSGDPLIFGRVAAEIAALRSANCAFALVPGISSALAAPLLAGIPLTDPVLSRCFAVLSAHDPADLNWTALAAIETLVVLMGGHTLPEIVQQLQQHSRSPQTPIAVIQWAGRPQQRLWLGTLATIVAQTAGEALSPCVMVIGQVVELQPYLKSLEFAAQTGDDRRRMHLSPKAMPLTGKTILVTRSHNSRQEAESSTLPHLLQHHGAKVLEMPALEIAQPSSWHALDEAIDDLHHFHWLILTSTNGIDYFFERLAARGKDARALAGIKIAVVGEKTAQRLHQYHLQPDFIPPDFVADALISHFPEPETLPHSRILFPRVETGGREVLVAEFTQRGAAVVEVAAYQSRCPAAFAIEALEALQQGTVDVVTFASSKTVKCFCQLLEAAVGERWLPLLADVSVASIGPQTSKTCTELLGRVDVEAATYTLEGLGEAIVNWVRDRE